MSFSKAFFLGLVVYIGLNIAFSIVVSAILGQLSNFFNLITSEPLILLMYLFGPILNLPGTLFISAITSLLGSLEIVLILRVVGAILPPILGSIASGRFGESITNSFGGWFLSSMVSAGVLVILFFIQISLFALYGLTITPTYFIDILISGIVNGVFYGCFSCLASKSEIY